jgi:hypothetical protein
MAMKQGIKLALRILLFLAAPAVCFASYNTSIAPTGGNTQQTPQDLAARTISVRDFGAQCDVHGGNGTIVSGSLNIFTRGSGNFTSADVGKPIVINGAGSWTLVGNITSGSPLVYNIGYNTPVSGSSTPLFHPSLIGAAGGASITYASGTIAGSSTIACGWA